MKIPKYLTQTEWVQPTEYPDLRSYDEIAIDLETRDPNLKSKGSGAVTGNGEVVGIAVATFNDKWYFPIAHGEGPNMNRAKTLEWFKDICECPATKIFHNAMYDVCWIRNLGIKINGLIVDTMIACSVLDENRFAYTLNALSWHYLNEGKNEKALNEAAKSRGLDPKAEMWKLPASEVGAYAEKDAELTFKLWQHVKKLLVEEDCQDIFNLETDLFPCLVDMRFLGVRVDVTRANQLKKELTTQEERLIHQVKIETGVETQIWAARSIQKVFEHLKLPFEKTVKTGAPSFTKNFLSNHEHPVIKMIAEARKINKVNTTFIDTILRHEHNGRIHAEINQIRSDDGGTVTGRFSYSNPNLQQIPAKDPNNRKCRFPKYEPILKGSDWGRFVPAQDHERMLELQAMGEFMKDEEGEFIKDKDGNKQKNYWHENGHRRAFTYKALNKLIQGSAADMTKKAMLELYKEGITPHIQIHDELDISIPLGEKDNSDDIIKIMETAVKLQIPNKVDYESGPNWGNIK